MEIDKQHIADFGKMIGQSGRIVISPHMNPDGDAIGASLGLWKVLRNMGKEVTVVVPNDYPEFLQWIDGSDLVINYERKTKKAKRAYNESDLLICLDFNNPDRAERLYNDIVNYDRSSMMVDHHPEPIDFCSLQLSYPGFGSTCELLFKVLVAAGFEQYIDKDAAESFYTGMMTDTGNFSYAASDPETYRVVARLLELGIDKEKVHNNVFHTFSESRWRLIGHSLKDKMRIFPEFNAGFIFLTMKELESYGYEPGDTEGLVNFPLFIKGIRFSALFIEKPDYVKVSFRSKGSFSTNKFARKHFNGGGHVNASGGRIHLGMKRTIEKFESLLERYKDELQKEE